MRHLDKIRYLTKMKFWDKQEEKINIVELEKDVLKIKHKAHKEKLSPESGDVWANYLQEKNNTLEESHKGSNKARDKHKKEVYQKIKSESTIKNECSSKDLDFEKTKEWVRVYQKYHTTVPVELIREQIEPGKDISLKKVISNNEKRSQMVKGFALTLGYSTEESEKWREVSAQLPHISDSLIKNKMEEIKNGHNSGTSIIKDFESWIRQLNDSDAVFFYIGENVLGTQDVYRGYEYKDLQEYDEHIWASGDSASDSVADVQQQDEQMQMYASGNIDVCHSSFWEC